MIVWSPGISLEEIERRIIEKAFEFYNRNAQTTANSLKIDVNELNKKKRKYEEDDKQIEISRYAQQVLENNFKLRARGVNTDEPIQPIVQEYSRFQRPIEEIPTTLNKKSSYNYAKK